jgi:membrane protein YdbS with pleckstrin-like domain
MVDTRVWGAMAILLTLVAVVLIGPELLHSITEGHMFVAAYGIAAVLAAVITLLIIGRGIATTS